jgi:hypothetical protein
MSDEPETDEANSAEPNGEAPITDAEAADLWAKIGQLDLSPKQRALVNMVFTIAVEVTSSKEWPDDGFDGSFEPGQAALIMMYQASATDYMVTKAVGHAPAALISRLISR